MLHQKYGENLDETANEYIHFILSEAQLMNRNLARLLQYTTIKTKEEDTKEINLEKIISEIQQQYDNESFDISIKFQGSYIKMQHQHAHILLSELISNAVRFRKENEDCSIEIKCELNEGYHLLSVKDYGIGIAPAYHSQIFKIFNKINNHEDNSAGVGLAICERIAQLYKGKISVESTLNKFSIFHVQIPV